MWKILGGVEKGSGGNWNFSIPPSKGSIEILVYKGGGVASDTKDMDQY